jgi:predicted YcjX-like family ATPase
LIYYIIVKDDRRKKNMDNKDLYYYLTIELVMKENFDAKVVKAYHSNHFAATDRSILNVKDAFTNLNEMLEEIIDVHEIEKKFFNKYKDNTIYQIITIKNGKFNFSKPLNIEEIKLIRKNYKLFIEGGEK